MERKLVWLALAVMLVAACGGGAAPATGGATGTPAGAATTAPTTAPGTAAATPAPTAAGPSLLDVLSAAKATQYKITYRITATGTGTEGLSGDQTWYFKPPRSRFDFTGNFGGQRMTMSVFNLPDGNFMCIDSGGTKQCLSAPATGSPLDQNQAAVTQRSLVNNPGGFSATFKESKTIAGQQALCYTVNAAAAAAGGFSGGTFCYSKEGLALSSSFTAAGGTWSMEATSVSTTVPDSDFTLPATPIKLP